MTARAPDLEKLRVNVGPDTPLRLDVAAALAFPDGSMTARGLRLEASKGRLALERIAGKYYTTLRDIREMRELCRTPKSTAGGAHNRAESKPLSASRQRDAEAAQARALEFIQQWRAELRSRKKAAKAKASER